MSEKNTLNPLSTFVRSADVLPKTISSEALLGEMKQIFILHEGRSYQLRITKLGKLILTK
ncbi:hemin uptake protein HemP [Polynucleobacter sp. JS-Polo-80-F4]|uniref:hemin uptake protein HemP n=1 Tax=Polynucleobacter sp. JS-Polo-80-F4 TaxID=2576918 RepID=UPI0021054348|nr:hemin uptake protein HemP [Polynucleobacter sp. JS-Polo-80-F4]